MKVVWKLEREKIGYSGPRYFKIVMGRYEDMVGFGGYFTTRAEGRRRLRQCRRLMQQTPIQHQQEA